MDHLPTLSNEEHARMLREWHQLGERRLDDSLPHEFYCTLCGIPFSSFVNEEHHGTSEGDEDCFLWVTYFVGIRIPKDVTPRSNTGVCLTGVGQWDQQVARLPPPGYDIRDVLRGRKPTYKTRYLMNEDEKKQWSSFEKITSIAEAETSNRSVYLMHLRCWDILQQQHALVASPTNKTCLDLNKLAKIFLQIPLGKSRAGFTPDWATDYGGPEPFWWIGWGIEDDVGPCGELIEPFDFDRAPQWHFLQRDPGMACGFRDLFAHPPLESASNILPRIPFTDQTRDIFSRLPEEILTEILVLLPSASVRDLQLASRKMASVHLSSTYWRSRFEFPNELCHVTLPPALMRSGQVGGQWVDWSRLCDQLLHPVGEEYGWWKNRKRIVALNKQLVKSMALRDSDGRLEEAEMVLLRKQRVFERR